MPFRSADLPVTLATPRTALSFRLAPLLLPLLLAAGVPRGAAGQSEGDLGVVAGASRAFPPSGTDAEAASYLFLGLGADRFAADGSGFFADLYAARSLQDEGDWVSAAAGGELRIPLLRKLEAGLAARGEAFTVGEPFRFRAATAEARPEIRLRLGRLSLGLVGRAGVGRSSTEIALDASDPRLQRLRRRLGLPADELARQLVTDLWHYGGGPEARLSLGPLSAGIAALALKSAAGSFRVGTADIAGTVGDLTLSADLSAWDTPSGAEIAGGVTLRVPLGGGWSASGGGGRSDPDPLLRTLPGGHGGVSVRRRIVDFGSGTPSPLHEVLEASGSRRRVRFSLHRPDAGKVMLLGDFTGWSGVPMHQNDGPWTVEVEVEPGTYHFGFRVDGEWYVPPDASGTVSDEWGQINATLVVPEDA